MELLRDYLLSYIINEKDISKNTLFSDIRYYLKEKIFNLT